MELTDNQILHIENELRQSGIDYQPLREELLDHLCCAIEEKMISGNSFETAFHDSIQSFGQQGIIQVQQHTIELLTKKTNFMKKMILLTSAMVLSVLTISIANNVMDPPSRYPTLQKMEVTSTYGDRMHPVLKVKKLHKGIDFKMPIGTPIVATADGTVKKVAHHIKGYGTHIVLQHDKVYESKYAHLSKINVKEGQQVKKGDIIGYSGNTGASMKPHLHYEVRKNGKAVNPKSYLP